MFSEASVSHSVHGVGRGCRVSSLVPDPSLGEGYSRYQVLSEGRIYLVPGPFWGGGYNWGVWYPGG